MWLNPCAGEGLTFQYLADVKVAEVLPVVKKIGPLQTNGILNSLHLLL